MSVEDWGIKAWLHEYSDLIEAEGERLYRLSKYSEVFQEAASRLLNKAALIRKEANMFNFTREFDHD